MKQHRLRVMLKAAGRRKVVCLRAFSLAVDGSDDVRLGEWELRDPNDERRDELATEIWQTVQADCDAKAMEQQYRVRMSGLPEGDEIKQWTMRQRPEGDAVEGDAPQKEMEATGAELTRMALSHANEAVKLLLSSQDKLIRGLQQQITMLQNELTAVRKRETDVLDLARGMMLAKNEARDDERAGERWDRGVEMIARYASAIGEELGVVPKGFDVTKAIAGAKTESDADVVVVEAEE